MDAGDCDDAASGFWPQSKQDATTQHPRLGAGWTAAVRVFACGLCFRAQTARFRRSSTEVSSRI